jgi:hypothetical protein
MVASYDTGGGGSPDQEGIIGARSEECTASRPAECRVRMLHEGLEILGVARYLRALTHPEWPPSSLTMSKS